MKENTKNMKTADCKFNLLRINQALSMKEVYLWVEVCVDPVDLSPDW